MKRKPYPAYKPSGVEWLGDVPEHWDALPLRRVVETVKTGGTPTGAEESAFDDEGFNWYSPGDFSDQMILGKSNRALSEDGKNEVRVFPPKTVMIVGIGATIGKVGLTTYESSCNQQINAIIFGKRMKSEFATYYLKTMRDFIVKCGKYTTLPIINQDETKNLIFTLPPLPEQQAIAAFLDRETGRIDALIAKKQRLLELLAEQRTALISRAVTKGLDASVKLKPSGVEWLGDVPEHWEVKRAGLAYSIQLGKMLQPDSSETDDEQFEYLKALHVQWEKIQIIDLPVMWASNYELNKYSVVKGDLLVCEGGEVGRAGILKDDVNGVIIQNSLHRVRSKHNMNIFLIYVLEDAASKKWFEILCNKATIAHFTGDKFSALRIPLPPLPEQQAIAAFLDRETGRIDALIAKVTTVIERLKEYRTALISSAVTGKIDVRAAV